MLTIDTIPLKSERRLPACNAAYGVIQISRQGCLRSDRALFIFLVQSMASAATAKLIELKPVRRVLFVFRRYVIAFLALRTLQNYIISRHFLPRTF